MLGCCITVRGASLAVCLLLLATSSVAASFDGRLAYLAHLHATDSEKVGERFTGSVRFADPPVEPDFVRLESLGVEFYEFGRGRSGGLTVYPARIPFAALAALAADPGIAHVDCAWRPGGGTPIHINRPAVQADDVWEYEDAGGFPVTGRGVLIADLDTGVDVTHPLLFALADASYAWLDLDGSGGPSGGDAIDLDGDGVAGPGERLGVHTARIADSTLPSPRPEGEFLPAFDLLFLDADGDGYRDGGPPDHGEGDPTYGERWFVACDDDGDGLQDPDESVRPLGDSKVRAVLERDGIVRRRGVDLLANEGDYYLHGTPVGSIAAGGWAGFNALSGVAPGAELLYANTAYSNDPPFTMPLEAQVVWARDEGADIVLIEDGTWVWQYMDGSSNLEILLNEIAAVDGVIVVAAAGNLALGWSHTEFAADDGAYLELDWTVDAMWFSFLWRGEDGSWPIFYAPSGSSPSEVPVDGTEVLAQDTRIWGHRSRSPRGTWRQDVRLAPDDGAWDPLAIGRFSAVGSPEVRIQAYHFDHATGWGDRVRWTSPTRPVTVSYPATADSCIVTSAYWGTGSGSLAQFAGAGPRIDGYPLIDLVAPAGIWTASALPQSDYGPFGGTSCAAPFVAGAAALLQQLFPDLDHGRCRRLLRMGAVRDASTMDPDQAGAGKLRILNAVVHGLAEAADVPASQRLAIVAYPNPFNATATLRIDGVAAGEAELRIFDARGRRIYARRVAFSASGEREAVWPGIDDRGRVVPSGVYFCYVRQGARYGVRRVTLLR